MSISPDLVRLDLGKPSVDEISDAEIEAYYADEGTFEGTLARCAEMLARKFAFQADYALMEYRESFSQKAKAWNALAKDLREKARIASPAKGSMPYAGGVFKADKLRQHMNPDRVRPMFSRLEDF